LSVSSPPARLWPKRLALTLLAVLTLLGGLIAWLNSDSGKAFVLAQLLRLDFQSGLTVTIDKIDGSLWSEATLKGVTIGDPKGPFLKAPALALNWQPWRFFLEKRLIIGKLEAPEVIMLRVPSLKPTTTPLLPDFDIRIGSFKVDRLVLEAPVLGQREQLSLAGDADIRKGRAQVQLLAASLAGDKLEIDLDAVPAKDRLKLTADLSAPANGTLAKLLGLDTALAAQLRGKGTWQRWDGRLEAHLGENPATGAKLASLALTNRAGRFSLVGDAAPALLLKDTPARLLGPVLKIDGTANIGREQAALDLKLTSPAVRLILRGQLANDNETIQIGRIAVNLLDPAALDPRFTGRNIRLQAQLAGTLSQPIIDWTFDAQEAGWGDISLASVRGAGIVRPNDTAEGDAQDGLSLPFSLTAKRLSGLAAPAADLLIEPHIDGTLIWNAGTLSGKALTLRTTKLSGTADLSFTAADASYRLAIKAALPSYALQGIGTASITADALVVPAPGGASISGRLAATLKQLENKAITTALGGLPRLATSFRLSPDLSLSLTDTILEAPKLRLAGQGTLSAERRLSLAVDGKSAQLGPLSVSATGALDAPDVQLTLARPGLGIGLAAVTARFQPVSTGPVSTGWAFNVTGSSTYGPLDARGQINTAQTPLSLQLESASVLGLSASGSASASPAGPLVGRIALRGPGLEGALLLSGEGAVQRLDLNARARDAKLPTTMPILIESGDLALVMRLPDTGLDAKGDLSFKGFETQSVRFDTGKATLRYTAGTGQASFEAAGTTAIPFSVDAKANFSPDEIIVTGKGQFDRQAITLNTPARIKHDGNDWVLSPFSLLAGDGKAELSGRIGDNTNLLATLDKISLGLITLAYPRLDFSGSLSGTINFNLPDGGSPRGKADLIIANFSRTGIASASLPITVGLKADLGENRSVARAVIRRAGRTEGQAQVTLGPVASGETSLFERLLQVPVTGLVRYAGPSQALWGLSGIDALTMRGPVSLAANIGGQVGDPKLNGTLQATGVKLEATILGAVIEDVALQGRFQGSRLELTSFSGRVGKNGSVSGTGGIDLSAERSFPIDIRLKLDNAQLLNRDDISGAASGTMRIATDEYGGVVSGKLDIIQARYVLGRSGVADVPVLNVKEINVRALGRPQFVYAAPTRWLFNLNVKGDNQLFVEGMGLQSEWQADLKILGGTNTPELNGRVQLVRGDYEFAGRRFVLTKGDVRFQGGYPPDPLIDVTAESTNSGFTALLAVNGTALKPAIKFSSVPVLPEDEVLSRLLFGDSVTNLSAPEAIQLAGALGSLRGSGGFNPVNAVRKGLGIDRLRILPADNLTGRGTTVAAGQYIGRNVYVELATDAQGYTATNIEVSLTRSLSILSEVATLGGIGGNLRWKRDY